MKNAKLWCYTCKLDILENDCRIDIPLHDMAEIVRDHNSVYHDGFVSLQTKQVGCKEK